MASELISFRLGEAEIEALRALQAPAESINLTAQRILKEALGVSTATSTGVDRETLEPIVKSIMEELTAHAVNTVNRQLTIQAERLEALEKPPA